MKPVIFAAVAIAAAVTSGNALAWNFIIIDKNGHETFADQSPIDLTYPPANQHMQLMYEGDLTPPSATPLTRQDVMRRRSGSTLIITDVRPSQRDDDWTGNKSANSVIERR